MIVNSLDKLKVQRVKENAKIAKRLEQAENPPAEGDGVDQRVQQPD